MQHNISKVTSWTKKHPVLNESWHMMWVVIGGLLVALGLEAFLIPMGFLDGGITGISIILAKFVPIPMGVFLGVLNIPFIILAWIKLGRRSAVRTTVGVATLSVSTIILHHMHPWTDNYVLALFYGGTLIGLGIGIALRNGGALDGTEALATVISNKSAYSVDQIILCINICIFIVAGFVMGWQQAMSSALLFYVVVAGLIDKVVNGGKEMKLATVYTLKSEEVAEAVHSLTKRHVMKSELKSYESQKGFTKDIEQLRFVLTRLEESEITDTIISCDPEAVVVFNDLSSLRGGAYEDMNSSH